MENSQYALHGKRALVFGAGKGISPQLPRVRRAGADVFAVARTQTFSHRLERDSSSSQSPVRVASHRCGLDTGGCRRWTMPCGSSAAWTSS
jgi:hypothetical protein